MTTPAIDFTRNDLTRRFLIGGRPVAQGEIIRSFRGEPFTFQGVYHPRKIVAAMTGDANRTQEFFPSVFGGEIQEQHGPAGTWTRTAS
jgi:hypothetical protein